MTQRDIAKLLDATFLDASKDIDREVKNFCGTDLMSEALAASKAFTTLLTGLCNPQVIRTAEMLDIQTVIFVRGKRPTDEMVSMARDRNIAVMCTADTMYDACGKIYFELHKGGADG